MKLRNFITPLAVIAIFAYGHAAFAQGVQSTASSTGTEIQENISLAIPVSDTVTKTNTWSSLLSSAACTTATVASGGLATIPAGNLLLNIVSQTTGTSNFYSCSKTAYETLTGTGTTTLNVLATIIVGYVLWVLAIMVNMGIWLLRLSSYLMTLMIGQGSFINNELVREAWPFVQGIANLGFIFALLYIAFATTLRLQSVSTSVQRLLPKLLIGALLVNFSLVIGGVLIDASRLVMAVEINLVGGGTVTIDNLPAKLLESSDIYGNVFQKSSGLFWANTDSGGNPIGVAPAKYDWSLVFEAIQSVIFVYALSIGMVVIALGLFWRYIMILLLLIASPLAYVAIALPQTKKWFDMWWSEFLKWVIYGPVMLFILILIIRVQAIHPVQAVAGDTRTPIYASIVRLIVTVTLLVVAAKISKSSSGAFAGSFMGLVNKTGQWAKKNPGTALMLASAGAAAPLVGAANGARYVGGAARNNVRDFTSGVSSNFLSKTRSGELFGKDTLSSKTAKFIVGPERDEKGKLKKGQESFLSPQADKFFQREGAIRVSNAAKIAIENPKNDVTKMPALSAVVLAKKSNAVALSKDQLKELIPKMDEKQLKAVLSHSDVIGKLDDITKSALLSGQYGGKNHDTLTPQGAKDHKDAAKDIAKMVDSRLRGLENAK